jgi:hypothetical protein
LAVFAIGGAALPVLVVAGVVAVIALRGKGGGGPLTSGAGLFSPSGLGINPLATKENFVKLDAGMTLDEVQTILGPATEANREDFHVAFGDSWERSDRNGPPDGQWEFNGKQAGVTNWYQWRSGSFYIFVGFAKGKKSGKLKALLSFWVESYGAAPGGIGMHGFESQAGILAMAGGDPDWITDKREEENRRINDPKWKKGTARQLLSGVWVLKGTKDNDPKFGYEFKADGTVKSFGFYDYTSAYHFIDNDHIEINVPAMQLIPARVEKHRVLVTQNELLLVREDGRHRTLGEYQRSR